MSVEAKMLTRISASAAMGIALGASSYVASAATPAPSAPHHVLLDNDGKKADVDKKFEDKKADEKKDADADADKEAVAVDKLPKAVTGSVKKSMPGARITKAAKLTDKDKKITYYLDDVKVGKKGWDLTVAEDGKILKKEECHDDD